MLKTYSSSFLLPKRLKLISLAARFDDHKSNMTTDGTIPGPRSQQPMLASQRAQASAQSQPSSDGDQKPQRGAIGAYFPLGYKEAATQWWTSISSRQAERNVLSLIPSLREADGAETSQGNHTAKNDPFGQRVWRSSMVQLSGKNRALNELSIHRTDEQVDDTLVMLHGYGAGLGFFYKNFEPLSRAKGWQLYALDMLGMGNSTRPPFKIKATNPKEKIAEAENWFIDALEEWRRVRKIEKFTLMGHSLGGYLAVSYALKYPGRLNKLILASPVGIPEDPWAVNADMPEPEESTMANEFTQDQESIANGRPAPGSDNNNFMRARDKKAAAAANPNSTTPPKRPLPSWLVWLWDANVSPFSIVRMTGPLGPRFVSGWTSRRFNHLPPDEKEALHTYSYSLFRQKGSGEYALPYILAPGAFARSPVINRIQDVGRQVVKPATGAKPAVRETGFPIVFMYGDNDWMDVAGGFAAEEKVKQGIVKALLNVTEEEKRREGGSAKVVIVSKAGHHLYIDNADEFNAYIRKEMEETRAQGLRERAMRS
ncbi:Alpha/Beta hydrolase protein [Lasiosphaeris hirsuta]|uniref:Alpha/Beta hydrolase protein n=1 Tax=Lasiosphaeris hirsuta TaxID=260670 RepID=A0AA40DVC0_9PEZI|nr:Alpha/Beta hydrolase protein [Lasiosphaeris hirsuta]